MARTIEEKDLNHFKQVFSGLGFTAVLALLLTLMVLATSAQAKGPRGQSESSMFIVELRDPAVVRFRAADQLEDRAGKGLTATSPSVTGARRLDVQAPAVKQYRRYLNQRFETFRQRADALLGEPLEVRHRYQLVMNGFAARMDEAQARRLAAMPEVARVHRELVQKLETYAGPPWIGAAGIWTGASGLDATLGEGMIVGVVDSGINWDSPAFEDNVGFDHTNPKGTQLGECSNPAVLCNDKLIGVYDFTDEGSNGKDTDGHGSHTASTAVGNPVVVSLNVPGVPDPIDLTVSGVAPRANLITYKACTIDDPETPDTDEAGCGGAAIIASLEQALEDGVDAVNYSIGGPAFDPWVGVDDEFGSPDPAELFLNMAEAGVFVATSAGNEGPAAGSISYPANAPWVASVGNASHDGKLGNAVVDLSGGSTPPPGDLVGNGLTAAYGPARIVHASDFGNALCGAGEAELQAACADHTGSSNPFPPGTFNGEIVVCDRGTYGRVEKSFNVEAAGAGGMILANTDAQGESLGTLTDDFCLPSVHIGANNGNQLRAWLDQGDDHEGRIAGAGSYSVPELADILDDTSSRGPNPIPAQDVLKPNLIAPGTQILAASEDDQSYFFLSGTSMASPHVAGAGTLLRALHPDWTPMEILSALQLTATPELARLSSGAAANPHERGSGRPRLSEAANSGLIMDTTAAAFVAADPFNDGQPSELNLPALVNSDCRDSCTFDRTVTATTAADWSATVSVAGGGATVSPANFSLLADQSQALEIDIDVGAAELTGNWVYGDLVLTADGLPEVRMPVAVFASGGALPIGFALETLSDRGNSQVELDGLVSLPDATYTTGGLVPPTQRQFDLPEDSTFADPFDGGAGVMTEFFSSDDEVMLLLAQTESDNIFDVDLYVGVDSDDDGLADQDEVLCSSLSREAEEFCELTNLPPGDYWVLVQNFQTLPSGDPTDDVGQADLTVGFVSADADGTLTATGPGIVAAGERFEVTLSWDNTVLPEGETWFGALGIGRTRDNPGNVGVVPVRVQRVGVAVEETFSLISGHQHSTVLQPDSRRERMFIDVPSGADQLQVVLQARQPADNDQLALELYRQPFADAFSEEPFVPALPLELTVAASVDGDGNGPLMLTVDGGTLNPGRWYVVPVNRADAQVGVDIMATVDDGDAAIDDHWGWWNPRRESADNRVNQGIEYNRGGANDNRFIAWYSYDQAGLPEWYFTGARLSGEGSDNVWSAELLRLTNDGENQQATVVGEVSITLRSNRSAILSYNLYGESGSEDIKLLGANNCPAAGNFYGHWFPGAGGLGGATVLVTANAEAQVHYFYDDTGSPAWLIASPPTAAAPGTNADYELLEFRGFCPTCPPAETSFVVSGVLSRQFQADDQADVGLLYNLADPMVGVADREMDFVKLSNPIACEN